MVKTGATSPRAPFVRKAPSFFAKPSPTSTLPSVVSATTLAAVEAGTATSTPCMPVAMLTGASRESVPPARKRHRAAELYLDHSRPRVPPTNATAGAVSLEALEQAGDENLNGKILIDISNPLDFSKGMPPTLWVSNTDSLGEQSQRRFPEARVVKTLHTMNAYLMVDPTQLAGADHTVFVSGDDAEAKTTVTELLRSFGWTDIIDLGDITTARGTEMLPPVWLRLFGALQKPIFNFKIVR
jgi:hypothetical protein